MPSIRAEDSIRFSPRTIESIYRFFINRWQRIPLGFGADVLCVGDIRLETRWTAKQLCLDKNCTKIIVTTEQIERSPPAAANTILRFSIYYSFLRRLCVIKVRSSHVYTTNVRKVIRVWFSCIDCERHKSVSPRHFELANENVQPTALQLVREQIEKRETSVDDKPNRTMREQCVRESPRQWRKKR